MAFVGIRALFKVYELLLEALPREEAIEYLESHAFQERMTLFEEDGEPLGVAFFWHVRDPYDVAEHNGYPGEDPAGKYLYFPYLYVRKDRRDGQVLKRLLIQAFLQSPAAQRMAYHRRNRLRVLRRVLLNGERGSS